MNSIAPLSVFFALNIATVFADTQDAEGGICWGQNEEYLGCKRDCGRTCKNYGEDIACTQDCVPGCYCKEGYVRDAYRNCILPSQCPPKGGVCLGSNEVYKTCGSACPKTCKNRFAKIACIERCVEGCFCRDGYVRDPNGNCVLPSQCPETVCWGQNEEYRNCKIECPRTCDNYDKEIGCTQDCVPGCYCKKGYVRDINGNCILPSQCPPQVQCSLNEEYSDCGSSCEPSCSPVRSYVCEAGCVSGCFCKRGYVRLMNPKHGVKAPCVRKYMCPYYI